MPNRAFDPSMTDGLPEPAARLLRHAIAPGTPLATECRLMIDGSMVNNGRRLSLKASEHLVPLREFSWQARAWLGPAWVRVRDHYRGGDGAVDIRLFSLIPLGGEHDSDTAASSRGRLAVETFWVPSQLLPGAGVTWHEVDEDRARVDLTIDEATESVEVTVDATGRITELRMQRWGDIGVPVHQPIPYGFTVPAERTFGGYKVTSQLEGGWWYGTDRYQPANASRFTITSVTYA